MNRASLKRKTPVRATNTTPGLKKNQPAMIGVSEMELTEANQPAQRFKTRIILFPNKEQSSQPTSAKYVEREHGVSPYYAKLIAELQGYDLGGA